MVSEQAEVHHADSVNFTRSQGKTKIYDSCLASLDALLSTQTFWPSNLANTASLLWHAFKTLDMHVNWSGFYVTDPSGDRSRLLLGPFMGKVACQEIEIGKGVCGAAALTGETQVVPDVNKRPGHIACDGETNSEVVVPIFDHDHDNKIKAVLDIDCLVINGFSDQDVQFLERVAEKVSKYSKW
ncbi:GAF domain-like protein [Lipomyces japonicus]|uniref:GAF domain-like protein n=1 Tax=Lipomyces japonicus TaxID=56871 RepID=UPI0034CEE0DA